MSPLFRACIRTPTSTIQSGVGAGYPRHGSGDGVPGLISVTTALRTSFGTGPLRYIEEVGRAVIEVPGELSTTAAIEAAGELSATAVFAGASVEAGAASTLAADFTAGAADRR
jgi:hypothetical protein